MEQVTLSLRTDSRDQVVDITEPVRQAVRGRGLRHGLCLVYCPHTTAGIAINEGYDPDVARDVLTVLDRLVPWSGGYRHAEGNTAAHAKAIAVGASQTVAVVDGELALGSWQAIQFYEFDGPRSRRVILTLLEAA
jgi:secondary thiamine-phosphate synthase enzyme